MLLPTSPSQAPAGPAAAPPPIARLLQRAGVQVNGPAPWDLQLHDAATWRRMMSQGTLGFGESYMDGQWDCERLDELVCRMLRANADQVVTARGLPHWLTQVLRHALVNLQSVSRAFSVAERHYDLGNDLFSAMLDSRMVYSCAYWPRAVDLEQAQEHKLELICRKLELRPGERLLDVGCGWGGLAEHAARHFGCEVIGATVSREQAALARERCAGLPVTVELADWRSLQGRWDKVVSVGMFEHVGPKNYADYFRRMHDMLADEGLFLLHTIGSDRTERATNAWTERYIFPNGKLPSAVEITRTVEEHFLIEDWHNFGPDYDRTLMAWWNRFERAWPQLRVRYGDRFFRMWKFYLLSSAGFFRSHQGQLWQIVLAPRERRREYRSVR
ncbi:MAG TPA: cyclopropane fatty acyl phospholipid synthase [Rubrivivax sp.]|nr:cyclopropane fatty acyl phospholipid synthase [Rubrivivax sp.]